MTLVFPVLITSAQQKAPAAQDNSNAPDFKFTIEEYNFGTVKPGDLVVYEFVYTNTGKDPLIITEAQGSCGCTVPEWPKEPLKKGEKGKIKVSFDSSGRSGNQEKTVTIYSNAKSGPKVLKIKGTVESPAGNQTK